MTDKTHTITGKTRLVGLIGWPVGHSISPAMHNAAFAQLGLDWAYVPLPVQPNHVREALQGVAALGFAGVNVTVPHKQAVIRYMDELSDAAQVIGAVNTIHLKDGKLIGLNTDAYGFLNALLEAGCNPKGMRVAVLGAGGAARAVVFALCRAEAAAVTLFNRTTTRAELLVDDLTEAFPDSRLNFAPFTSPDLQQLGDAVDLVVNTTSVGMSPHIDDCPWPDDVPIPANATFNDLVYNPRETVFLRRARQAGRPTIDGVGMLVHQGAFAFETWTGHKPPINAMREAGLRGLGLKG
jgi:shikimate dehydrogenase